MRTALALVTVAVLCACSSNQPSNFALTGATVDASHWCPGGSHDAPYDVHVTVDAHNGTSAAVNIESVTAAMTLESVTGTWLEKVGDRYDASKVTFDPSSVAAGSTSHIKLTFASSCTSGQYGAGKSSQGDYLVTMRLTTSAGSYSISASNRHSILAA
ncbi:MAG TPA: hypothetical protein VHQ03_06740 [Candidatus Dormibacteraeota bacterium]|nr:hypothetical protein [Candidatus Dormibacteraeota bacterium]